MKRAVDRPIDWDGWLRRIGVRRVIAPFVAPEADLRRHPRHSRWSHAHCHSHPSAEILLALRGTALCSTSLGCARITPGTLVVFAAGEPHDLNYPPWSPDLDHLWLLAVPNRVFAHTVAVRAGRMHPLGPPRVLESDQTGVDLFRVLEILRSPSAPPTSHLRRMWLVGAVTSVLVHLASAPASDVRQPHRHAERMSAICRHLEETAGRNTSIAALARLAGLSPFYFVRLFKRYQGQTVHQYVNTVRRSRLRELQSQGSPMKVIAQELGFSCSASFSRWRRRQRI